MKAAASWEYKNGKRIVALVGEPPRPGKKHGAPDIDVISLRFQKGARFAVGTDQGVYLTPDEAAITITVLGQALANVTRPLRVIFALRERVAAEKRRRKDKP